MILKKFRRRQRFLVGLAILIIAANPAVMLYAQMPVTFDAREPISMNEALQLDFKRIRAPTSGVQTFTVAPNNDPSVGAGDGNFVDTPQRGIVEIFGTDGQFFSISSAEPAGTGDCTGQTGIVRLTDIVVFPMGGNLPGSVEVGGTLEVAAGAEGAATCPYTITVDYLLHL